jgi:hypothetical protein
MSPEERKRLREQIMLGILGFGKNVYQGNPALKAIGDPIRDVYRNYDVALQGGLPQVVMSDTNPLRVEINRGQRPRPHTGMPSTASPFSPALLAERRQANKQRGPFSPELLAGLRGRGVGARHHAGMAVPKPKEKDEYGFLDAMFLANLVAGMQGGPPPTPYGTAVGGGNKTWASLPTLMRMS